MTPMFSIFTLAIKFDCLFLAILQSFHLFKSCIFDKIAPPNICLKRCSKSLFSPFQCIQQSQKCYKRVFFLILHFGRHANGGGGGLEPSLATLLNFARYLLSNQIFHYTRCNTSKRVTSFRGPSPRHCACGQHCFFRRNVAAIASCWQHCVRFDGPEI